MDSPDVDLGGYDHDTDAGYDDGPSRPLNGAKRRRIARACDLCRKKKIKCDGKAPSCSHCQNSRVECIFTVVEKKRNPPKGAKYIEGLENRLKRMESLLQMSGLVAEETGDTDALAGTRTGSAAPESSSERAGSAAPEESSVSPTTEPIEVDEDKECEVEALSEMMCSLITDQTGSSRYIGSSSGLSIFSPRGIEWVNEQVGDQSFKQLLNERPEIDRLAYLNNPVFGGVFTRRIFQPLPARAEVYSLVRDFFDHFNFFFPLFREDTFMQMLALHYTKEPPQFASWWAALNMVLAIGCQLRVMGKIDVVTHRNRARGFFKNAFSVSMELSTACIDIMSVQALLLMAFFIQSTSRLQTSFFLVSAAIKVSHSLGLHKRASAFGIDPAESEHRRRVFWSTYIFDKDISLRSGWPSNIDDDDISVEYPIEKPFDNAGLLPVKDGTTTNQFLLMCQLARIQSKIYRGLYTVKASKKTASQILETIGNLDEELAAWRVSIPEQYRQCSDTTESGQTTFSLHILFLNLGYHGSVSAIHRIGINQAFWSSKFGASALASTARPLNPRIFKSAELCVTAARETIRLARDYSPADISCMWMVVYYPVAAMITLFVHILQNPLEATARSDLRLIHTVTGFLKVLREDIEDQHSLKLHAVALQLEQVCRDMVDRCERSSRPGARKGRGSNSQASPPRPDDGTASADPYTRPTADSDPRPNVGADRRPAGPARSQHSRIPSANAFPFSQTSNNIARDGLSGAMFPDFLKTNMSNYPMQPMMAVPEILSIPSPSTWLQDSGMGSLLAGLGDGVLTLDPIAGMASLPPHPGVSSSTGQDHRNQSGMMNAVGGGSVGPTGSLMGGFSNGIAPSSLLVDDISFLDGHDADLFSTSNGAPLGGPADASGSAASALQTLWQVPLMADWDWGSALNGETANVSPVPCTVEMSTGQPTGVSSPNQPFTLAPTSQPIPVSGTMNTSPAQRPTASRQPVGQPTTPPMPSTGIEARE